MRIIRYFAFNTVFALSLYFGFFGDIEPAKNIAYFIAWLSIITSLFTGSDEVIEYMREKGRVIPKRFDATFDLIVTAVFVWSGAWVTASFYLVHWVLFEGAWVRAAKPETVDGGESDETQS